MATGRNSPLAHPDLEPTRVGIGTSWFWAPLWFSSQTRYLQRRVNILHDVLASHAVRPS